MFDETFMQDQIEQIRQAVTRSPRLQRAQRVWYGLQRLLVFWWWLIGRIDAHFAMSGLFVFTGFVQLAIALNDGPARGMSMLEDAAGVSGGALALMFVTLGWLIAYTRSVQLLTLGGFVLFGYAAAIIYGTFTGAISQLGYLAAVYIVFGTFGFLRASYSETIERAKWQKALAAARARQELSNEFRPNS